MIDLFDFYHEEIEPRLFSRIGEILPDFSYIGGKWLSPNKLDGSPTTRRDKTVINDTQRKGYMHLLALEQGGEAIDVLALFMRRRGATDKIEAVKALAQAVGVEIPKGSPADEERYKARRQKQERLRAILSAMQEALFSPAAAEELAYLKEKRGYSEEYIKSIPIGFIEPSMSLFRELSSLLHYYDRAGGEHRIVSDSYRRRGVGYTHRIAIAYIAAGDIKGFSFRALTDGSDSPKYYTHYIGEYDTQRYYPIALPYGRLTAYSDRYFNFTLVEGLLDTYRGQAAGIPNVVGISQGGLSAEQLAALKAKGARSITVMKDTEAHLTADGKSNEASIKENSKAVAKAVNMIHSQGLSAYVVSLPSPDGAKVDLDSYLKGLDGEALQERGRQVQEMIAHAESGYIFLFRRFADTYENSPQGPQDRRLLLKDMLSLFKQMKVEDGNEKKEMLRLYQQVTGIPFSLSDVEEAEVVPDEAPNSPQSAAEEAPNSQGEEFTAEEYQALRAKYRKVETMEEGEKRREGKRRGVPTPYTFHAQKGGEEEKLLLPSSALTYVCLPTSHGKTRLLENIALQVAMEDENGVVPFFTVEESADDITDEFLNIYYTLKAIEKKPTEIVSKQDFLQLCQGTHLSSNNLRTIRGYYAAKGRVARSEYFRGRDSVRFNRFEHYKREFFSSLIETERLKIFYDDRRSIDTIAQALHFLQQDLSKDGKTIKAVFIDYIQRLRKEGKYPSRKEELTAVTSDLMSLSIEMGIPFVIGAQLKRDTPSPLDMDAQNISDAAEIELSANTVILGWNTAVLPYTRGSTYFYGKEGKLNKTREAEALEIRTGIELGEGGDLYLRLAKNRGGLREVESRLYFDVNSGLIIQGERPMDEIRRNSPTAYPHSTEEEVAEKWEKLKMGKRGRKDTSQEQPLQEVSDDNTFTTPSSDCPF